MATSTRKPPAPASGDAAEVAKLLTWARAHRFGVHGVTVGKVTITCTDLAPLPPPKAGAKPKTDGPADIYAEFGGKAWTEAQKTAEAPAPGDDEDGDDD